VTELLCSVVLPVKDGAATIDEQLTALAAQEVPGAWELVVVDNGSTDATREILDSWADRLPLRVIEAPEADGVSGARNAGTTTARSDRLLFCDCDDVIQPGWIAAMSSALDDSDIAGGHLRDDLPTSRGTEGVQWFEPYPTDRLPAASGGPPFAPGAAFAVRREVVEALGGWDQEMQPAEDIDFSWRARQAGFRLQFVPEAVVAYRQRSTALAVARQAFAYGYARRRLQARHRSLIPSRRGPAGRVLRTGLGLSADLILRPSRTARLRWLRWVAYALGWASSRPSATRVTDDR
jgi:glycosyltransferase involved in cell wall biosynthesis